MVYSAGDVWLVGRLVRRKKGLWIEAGVGIDELMNGMDDAGFALF
jgi:hypothetical protein